MAIYIYIYIYIFPIGYALRNALPKSDAKNNWRKAVFSRELSPAEMMLLGDGAGTQWEFEWKEGKFPVKFKDMLAHSRLKASKNLKTPRVDVKTHPHIMEKIHHVTELLWVI